MRFYDMELDDIEGGLARACHRELQTLSTTRMESMQILNYFIDAMGKQSLRSVHAAIVTALDDVVRANGSDT